jgi:hypothetical protein
MSIGSQVDEALRKLVARRFEDAAISTSVALSATARLEHPDNGDKRACRLFLEQNLAVICKVGWVAFGLSQPINFLYRSLDPRVKGPRVAVRTMPEMLYDVVRCTAVHEAVLPSNLKFTDEPVIETGRDGELVLPADLLYGLLVAIVGSASNAGQTVEGNPLFSFAGRSIRLNELWGQERKVAQFLGLA